MLSHHYTYFLSLTIRVRHGSTLSRAADLFYPAGCCSDAISDGRGVVTGLSALSKP